jgi:hypothetical protein
MARDNTHQEDAFGDEMMTESTFTYKNIAAAATTLVKTGAGELRAITINTTAAGTITVYDSLTATGNKIATIKASVSEQTLQFDVGFSIGLTIVTGAASDITVAYR